MDSIDQTKLYKFIVSTDTESLIITRTKNIARCWFDRTNDKIYFIDCNYDGGTSFCWSLLISDDSITEVKSFADCDVFDIFKIGTTMFVNYFEAGGYTLEETTMTPEAPDVTTEWTSTGANHYTEVDDAPAAPSFTEEIYTQTDGADDNFNFTEIDLSAYDSGEIYEITTNIYCKADTSTGGTIHVTGSATGTTASKTITPTATAAWHTVTWSGLSLIDSDLDTFQVNLEFNKGTEVTPSHFHPNGDSSITWDESPDTTTHWSCLAETGDFPTNKFIYTATANEVEILDMNTITLPTNTNVSEIEVWINGKNKCSNNDAQVNVYAGAWLGTKTFEFGSSTGWTHQHWTGLSITQAQLDGLQIKYTSPTVTGGGTITFEEMYVICHYYPKIKVGCVYNTVRFYGNEQYFLNVENLTTSAKHSNDMGSPAGRTYDASQMMVKSATETYFLWAWSDENVEIWCYNNTGGTIIEVCDCGAGTELPATIDKRTITYDNSDVISFTLFYDPDYYYCTYSIGGDTFTKKGEYDIILMLDRNCDTSNDIGFNTEKGFSLTEDKVYQISKSRGNLWLISVQDFDDVIIAISDTYLITDAGTLYKYQDMMPYIVEWWVDHPKEDYPVAEVLLRSNYINVAKNMLMQLIGYYTANGNAMYYKHSPDSFNDETPKVITIAGDIDWIDDINLPNTCSCELVDEYDNMKNVLKVTHDGGASDPYVVHNFAVVQTVETYEFYWGNEDASDMTNIIFYDSVGTMAILLQIDNDKYYYYNLVNAAIEIVGVVPTDGNLDHFKVAFNCTTDTFDLYINETIRVTGGEFRTVVANISKVRIDCQENVANSTYLSAPAEIWDNDYVEGDNLHVAKGTPDQVCFEGLVKAYDARTLRVVRLESPAKEMDQVKPSGSKAGRTDEIITDMNNDLNGIAYISMGTLTAGTAMGTLTLAGDKTWRTLIDNFKDIDTFTWYLTPTGELYYNNGELDTLVAIQYDGTTYFDPIEDANGYFLSSEVNQVIVRGSIGIESETEHGINLEDQQKNGVILLIVRDATLNTTALCNAKADAIIARTTAITTIDCQPEIGDLGFIQPGQVFTFKFTTTDVSITEDTFTIDRIKIEAKSEQCMIIASNGLIFELK